VSDWLIRRFRAPFPSPASNDGVWSDFKRHIYGEFVDAIRRTDRAFADEPHLRAQKIRELRREHHLIVVADRIRRNAAEPRALPAEELRKAAAFVLDRSDHVAAPGAEPAGPRSHAEENMLTSARVNWHKLMKRAGSPAELRGGRDSGTPDLRGATLVLKKIRNPRLSAQARGHILRQHVQERLAQLVLVAGEAMSRGDCALAAEDIDLIDEIARIARRMPRSKR